MLRCLPAMGDMIIVNLNACILYLCSRLLFRIKIMGSIANVCNRADMYICGTLFVRIRHTQYSDACSIACIRGLCTSNMSYILTSDQHSFSLTMILYHYMFVLRT